MTGHPGLMVRDALTGVYARVALIERLEEEVHRGHRYGDSFSILMLDLDHFKSVNDAFGHARGDATLTEFVERVHAAARNSDVLFRYGGDEFVLFLPRTTHEQATVLATRLVEHVCSTSFAGQPPLSLTVSAGVATLPDDGGSAEELLARADARMYTAKREGRARVVSVDLTRDAEHLLDESSRLIERLDALDRANRFFDSLPGARSGVLRVIGPAGAGRSRVLMELEKLAGLRGHRVISLIGRRERSLEPFAALREAIPEAADLPTTLPSPGDVAALLRRAYAASSTPMTTITIDNVGEVDRATLDVVRGLLACAGGASAIGVILTGSESDTDPAPPDTLLRDTITLQPLSRDGVRAWVRSIFRWEPPIEFIEWVHEQSRGLPGAVRHILLQLVERRLLLRDESRWMLADGFRAVNGFQAEAAAVPRPKGIRPPISPLIGRENSLRQILRLLRTTRLVSLRGPGGSGKTRLALEVAIEAFESFRDGVALVTLRSRGAAVDLAAAIAATLELESLPGPDPWIALARELRPRKMLLVLDGVDGIAGGTERLTYLLELAPDLRILVTSRTRLHIKEEWVFDLEGLRVPKSHDSDRARGFSSVQLFIDRATAVNPPFSIGDADLPSVSRICQLLDGLPLAIEIAAAQTAMLSCREIANDLETSLEGFASYLPTTPPDQQRFRAIMEQTWRLLPEETRIFLRRAAVFDGEFDDVAAARIMGARASDLDGLVQRALLSRHAGRYAVHSLVQDYALHKLDEFPRDRHDLLATFSAHYLELARDLGTQLRNGSTEHEALARFTAELPNIRRAWTMALVIEQHALLASSGSALFDFFEARHFHVEAEPFFQSAMNWFHTGRQQGTRIDERVSALVLARYGASLLHSDRIEEARRRLTMALARSRRLSSVDEEAFCLRFLALVELAAGHTDEAQQHARNAVLLARRAAEPHAFVLTLRDAALVASAADALSRAVEYLLEAIGVDGPCTAKTAAWAELLNLVEKVTNQGNIRLAGAVLLQVMGDPTAPDDIHARAEGLLTTLRSAVAQLTMHSDPSQSISALGD